MRYIMQIVVMLSDILIFLAIGITLYYGWRSPIVWLFIIMGYLTWKRTGGFEAWKPKTIKQFLVNAKALGL